MSPGRDRRGSRTVIESRCLKAVSRIVVPHQAPTTRRPTHSIPVSGRAIDGLGRLDESRLALVVLGRIGGPSLTTAQCMYQLGKHSVLVGMSAGVSPRSMVVWSAKQFLHLVACHTSSRKVLVRREHTFGLELLTVCVVGRGRALP